MPAATWDAVLDELEQHVERAERLVRSSDAEEVVDWVPPTHLGPLPRHQVTRVRGLLDRQRAVIARIPGALAATRQRIQVGDRIGRATSLQKTPVYIDVTT
jgi:hypothetical protein